MHWVGGCLALAGLGFIGLRLWQSPDAFRFGQVTPAGWALAAVLVLAGCLANVFLVLAWRELLAFAGASIPPRRAIRVYGISQLGRYVPGNIFHIVGRQALGVGDGIAGMPLAKSAAWEIGTIALVGALVGMLALPALVPAATGAAGALLSGALLAASAVLAARLAGPAVARAMGWHALFLVATGLIFAGCVAVVSPSGLDPGLFPILCGAYSIAWLAGLLTPGAPAGVGVRELALLFLVSGWVAETHLLQAVVFGRLVSIAGDVLFFLVASGVRRE